MLDDKLDLPPWAQFFSPLIASIIIVATGSGIVQVTNPFGPGAISLVWTQLHAGALTLSLPADIITIAWLLTVTYAMKFLDGLDGLVAGLAMIGAFLIAGLAGSEAFFQPLVALMALVVAGAHLGFLPMNRQGSLFLGEAGSTIAGFSLGVLAVISGAKVATAAVALGVPLVDIALVVIGRVARGVSPFKGDDTHLHFRLLKAGLSRRSAVRLIWGIALIFGLAALSLQTKGKIFLFAGLVALVLTISYVTYVRARKHGMD
jgi:UDP-GlcNAc:undecaprenyl-phosphate GlcNAc-1-phosphate transferase